jgi:Tol biopolymer transport system component
VEARAGVVRAVKRFAGLRLAIVAAVLAAAAVAGCMGGDSSGTPSGTTEPSSPVRGVIVYWKESPGPSIWSIRPEGSQPRRILRNAQNAKRPRLSPDRKWVAFDGAPPGKPVLTDFDIQLVRADGTGLRTLTSSSQWDMDAQWSPDGKRLSFTRMPPGADWLNSWTWTMRSDGSDLRRIARGLNARWSPDGAKLVLDAPTDESQGDIFIVDADGSGRRLVLASPELDQPAGWSPDGKRILFTRLTDSSGMRADVCVVNADGTGMKKLAEGFAGSWSPDGTEILYADSFPGQMWIMEADGSDKRRISGAFGAEPHWR